MSVPLPGVGFGLGIALAALTTLATVLTVGVAFLSRPSRATLYWSFTFVLASVGVYGVVAGELNEIETMRRASLGALMGAPALLWSGFRALWGLRPLVWVGAVLAIAASLLLGLVDDTARFTVAYRIVFFAASVFGALLFVDWARVSRTRANRFVLPLAVASLVFFGFGVATVFAGILSPPSGGDDLALLRRISSIGMLVYVTCALVAVIATSTRHSGFWRTSHVAVEWQRVESSAAATLAQAARTSEAWSIVYLRLDDAADIRQIVGPTALVNLSRRFETQVRGILPAESDVGSPSAGTVVAVVPGPDRVVRDLLRTILDRVMQLDVYGALPVRPTASAGWAPASLLGYDFGALVLTGGEAATLAREKGGDRWERVDARVIEQLISRSELP